jgi:tetratricopeptide (TPR) repeat protein
MPAPAKPRGGRKPLLAFDDVLRALLVVAPMGASLAHAAADCSAPAGRVVAIQGSVEGRQGAASGAGKARPVCPGEEIRVPKHARAALVLANQTTVRLDQETTLVVREPAAGGSTLLELLRGAIHVITRTPQPFKVNTPFVNAAVEGTEFAIEVGAGQAQVATIEGQVALNNAQGSLHLVAGELALVAANQAPSKQTSIRPADAVQWALYYPAVIDYRVRGERAAAGLPAEALELYRQGQLAQAIFLTDRAAAGPTDAPLLIFRASLLLAVGQVDEAQPELARALAVDPHNSDAQALAAIIAVARNDKAEALRLADKAVETGPASPAAHIARSYAQQAHFRIEEATASVKRALELQPDSALAWARLAELQMAAADLDGALASASKAAEREPDLAKTQTVLGFAHLTRSQTPAAKAAFGKAIALDPEEPTARLGLGLAQIREGQLKTGREEIEIAASLDPGNALIRSYLGKAYAEEKRPKLAGAQFDLAKAMDPKDPTPWFYDALVKQEDNRPVQALDALEKSVELNDNRAVYRTGLLLDEDRAARGASQARIYDDLGFSRLALLEATLALEADPRDHAAHRFLADAYGNVPGHDIARVSELLQSQLRQPIASAPVEPQLADDRPGALKVGVLRGIGPGSAGFNEYGRSFDRNGLSAYVDAVRGSYNTWGDQAVVMGIRDNVSFSVGQYRFQTDGISPHSALSKDVLNAFVQAAPTQDFSVQAEYRSMTSATDEIYFPWDREWRFEDRLYNKVENFRLGARYALAPNQDLLVSAMRQDRKLDWSFVDFPRTRIVDTTAEVLDLQYGWVGKAFSLTAGATQYRGTDNYVLGDYKNGLQIDSAYAYGRYRSPDRRISVSLGLTSDHVRYVDRYERTHLSPKLGIVWSISPSTVLRAAAFQSVQRQLIANQALEPTQVAGFNQFFDEATATVSRRVGLGLDHRLAPDVYAGIEASRRRISIPEIDTDSSFPWRELSTRGYVYWRHAPSGGCCSVALGIEPEYQRLNRSPEYGGNEGILGLRTLIVPINVRTFVGGGFSAKFTGTYVRQSGELLSSADPVPTNARLWLADLSLDYRLPDKWGVLSIGAKNVFDRRFPFVETDPGNPRFAQSRFVFARLFLAF